MSKRYLLLLTLFAVFIAAIFLTQKKEPVALNMKPKLGKITSSSEWINTKKTIAGMEDQLRKSPDNIEVIKTGAGIYAARARYG